MNRKSHTTIGKVGECIYYSNGFLILVIENQKDMSIKSLIINLVIFPFRIILKSRTYVKSLVSCCVRYLSFLPKIPTFNAYILHRLASLDYDNIFLKLGLERGL